MATVFAGAPAKGSALSPWDRHTSAVDAHERGRERQDEDLRALQRCGVEAIHLEFVGGGYGSAVAAWGPILKAIEEVARGFDEVWVPAGIGDHRDHLLVARLATRAARTKKQVVYADMPYTLSVDWRKMLACAEERPDAQDWLEEQGWISSQVARVRPRITRLSAQQRADKRLAVRCYSSQTPVFDDWLDDDDRSGWEVAWDRDRRTRRRRPRAWPMLALARLPAAVPSAPLVELPRAGGRGPRSGPATAAVVLGTVDRPEPGEILDPGHVEVAGWAYSADELVSSVEVWLSGQLLGRAGLGRPRPDVVENLRDPGAALAGFEFRGVATRSQPAVPDEQPAVPDEDRIEVVVTLRDGSQMVLPAVTVKVGVTEAMTSPVPDSALPRPRQGGSRRGWVVAAGSACCGRRAVSTRGVRSCAWPSSSGT